MKQSDASGVRLFLISALAGVTAVVVPALARSDGTGGIEHVPVERVGAGDEQVFAIGMRQKVADRKPGSGAGNIERPGSRDVYTFLVEPGTRAYFDELTGTRGMRWRCVDAGHGVLFDDADMSARDPGFFSLDRGGEYTITVSARVTGTYSFRIWEVPSDVLPIGLHEPVSGSIDAPGTMDVFTFEAEPGTLVYFDEVSGGRRLRWECIDSRRNTLFTDTSMCAVDPAVFELELGGRYSITVADGHGAGKYTFVLWKVDPPESFDLRLDEVVSEGRQGIGSGHIERPGAQDVYALDVSAPTTVCFQAIDGGCRLRWTLVGPDRETLVRRDPLCGNGRRLRLDAPGRYTIIVWGVTAGTYAFMLDDAGSAELTGDCTVDDRDLFALLGAWGSRGGDLTGDEDTDATDLVRLLAEWDR